MILRLTVELTPEQAAALYRLMDKLSMDDAQRYLYPHVIREIRDMQAQDMIGVCCEVQKALAAQGIRAWPWIDTGRAETPR